MRNKKRKNEWCKERSDRGLCPECGQVREDISKYLCERCRNLHRQYARKYYQNKPHIKEANNLRGIKWQKDNADKVRKSSQLSRQRLKEDVFSHYGNRCACCGESHTEFFTIDHINNNGNEHRRQLKNTKNNFYSWIKQNNYPEDLQILCWNCNQAKAFYGACPHTS